MKTEHESIPVDYKFGSSHNGVVHLNHKYQLAAYALLVEENFKTIVRRGFIHYSKDRVNVQVDLNDEIRRHIEDDPRDSQDHRRRNRAYRHKESR